MRVTTLILGGALLVGAGTAIPATAERGGAQLAAAQRAAWGRTGSTVIPRGKERIAYQGGQLVQTGFGPVLVAEGKVEDFSHSSAGRVGVFYLRSLGGRYSGGRAYPDAVVHGSYGKVGEWGVSRRFGSNPVIWAEGGFTGQGITCSSMSLTMLTPRGPVEVATIPTGYESPDGTDLTGKIGTVVPGRYFTVDYRGSRRWTDTYRMVGGKYRLAGRNRFPTC